MISIPSAQKVPRGYSKHGLSTLKAAVKALGGRSIDRRTAVGRALVQWRSELVCDLGGNLSAQQVAVVDLAVRSRLLLDSIDAWLLTQPSLIDKRRRAVLPVVRERQQLADGLARYLQLLGLERVAKTIDLSDYLSGAYHVSTATNGAHDGTDNGTSNATTSATTITSEGPTNTTATNATADTGDDNDDTTGRTGG